MQLPRSGICVKRMLVFLEKMNVLINVLIKNVLSGFVKQEPGAIRIICFISSPFFLYKLILSFIT